MGQFSRDMRKTATDLIKQFGSRCVLTKVSKNGEYDPNTGNTVKTTKDFPMYGSVNSEVNRHFAPLQNTNLLAFTDKNVMIAWFGEEVDATWLYNGQNIILVQPIETQDDIVAYTITVGEKD